jgi:integrase
MTRTIGDVIERYWEEHAQYLSSGARTVKSIKKKLLRSLKAGTKASDFGSDDVASYVRMRVNDGVKSSTINRELTVLEAAWSMAMDRWEVQVRRIRWRDFRFPEEERQIHNNLSWSEISRMVSVLNGLNAPHIASAMLWSIYTGTRLNGTRSLRWRDVNLVEGYADIPVKRKPGQRGPRVRRIRLSPQVVSILEKTAQGSPRPHLDDHVFDLTNRASIWVKARAMIGRQDITWHGLRHSHARALREVGTPIEVVQRSLGHSSISTTMVYLNVSDEEVEMAVGRFPEIP